MRDDGLLERVSAYADGELDADEASRLEADLADAPEARAFLERVESLRRGYRYATAEEAPDLSGRVVDGIRLRRRPSWQWAAAVFLAGVAAGAAFMGLVTTRGPGLSAATIPDRITAAQRLVSTLEATVQVTEHGWHPAVPVRRYQGTVRYEAPERLAVELRDATSYPGPGWVANNVVSVVDEGTAWSSAPPACPREALPECTPPDPRVSVTAGLEPFPDAVPVPLDLIVPVVSFAGGTQPEVLGEQTVGDRPAVGVRVTVAQIEPLLSGFLSAGNWRALHPTDVADLWLDEETLVPLSLTVRAAGGEDRALWAVRRGYPDGEGDELLEVTWGDVAVNAGPPGGFPSPPTEAAAHAGFDDVALDGVEPASLPTGMRPHREGVTGTRNVRSWSDGRAWVKVAWTTSWQGGRLFGDLGLPVRTVTIPRGVAYVDERGERVAIHGDAVEIVVTGSLPADELVRIAGSLGFAGAAVPGHWPESGAAGVDEAEAAMPGLLLPAVDGYGHPTIVVADGVVTIGFAGPGARGFTVVQSLSDLPPPLDADVRGVAVRGTVGRWSPERGRLEWTESGMALTLQSRSLGLDEMLDVAASMDHR